MKYILKIMLLSLASIPFFIWYALVTVWTFRTDKFVAFKSDVLDTLNYQYRRAFPYKPNRSHKRNIL